MVVYSLGNKCPEYRSELQSYCSKFIGEMDWALVNLNNENFSSDLETLIEFTLQGPTLHAELSKALNRLIQYGHANTNFYPYRIGKILSPFFKHWPKEALSACHLQDSDGSYYTALRMLSVQLAHKDTAVGVVPEGALIDWCMLSPDDRYIFAAHTCKLFDTSNPNWIDDQNVTGISSTAKSVLALAPDKQKILEIFVGRSCPNSWSGSLAAIMRQRCQLLDQLNPNEDERLRILIYDAKARFSKKIASEEQQEQDREISRTASFE